MPMPGRNIIADWLFNSLGDNVFDLSGHGHIGGMIGNPAWDNGKLGHGLRCDGVLDHVFVPGNINFTEANSFSVIVLFSTTQAGADNYIVGTGLADGWYLRLGSVAPAGRLMVKVDDTIDDAWVQSTVAGYHDGDLHQLVLVWDAPNNLIEGFIDGISLLFSKPDPRRSCQAFPGAKHDRPYHIQRPRHRPDPRK